MDRRIRQIRVKHCTNFALVIGDHRIVARDHELVYAFPHTRFPTLIVANDKKIDVDLLVEAAPALTKLVRSRHNTLETMLTRLTRHGFCGSGSGPTNEQYARSIQREITIVQDYFSATHAGINRRVMALMPIVYYIKGEKAANSLTEKHAQLGQSIQLKEWLNDTLGQEEADRVWNAVDETDNHGELRRKLNFDFAKFNAILSQLEYATINDEDDFRRIFEVYINDIRPELLDRVRRRYRKDYKHGESLDKYLEHKTLDFVVFDQDWPLSKEKLDRDFVKNYSLNKAEDVLGPDDQSVVLPALDDVNSKNKRLVLKSHRRMTSLARAWCKKNSQEQHNLMDPSEPQMFLEELEQSGLLDFEILSQDQLPSICKRMDVWPRGMPQSFNLKTLSLDEEDLNVEEREAREAKLRAEIKKRTIKFDGIPLDTKASDFARQFSDLADKALNSKPEWLERSKRPRLIKIGDGSPKPPTTGGGGSGGKSREQPRPSVLFAMGICSEYLAHKFLKDRHPREMSDRCWVSGNRKWFCPDGELGDDSLGYDFRVVTDRNEWLYEVKSALDDGGEFELTARELEVAGSAAMDRKRRFRILYVPFVFDPDRWRVLTLPNPVGEATRNQFKVIRTGSVRYGFSFKGRFSN